MMEFEYVVHGTSTGKTHDKVLYDGEEVMAELETFEVELTAPHDAPHGGGTFTMRFKGKNLSQARQEFVADQCGTWTWTPSGKWARGKEIREPAPTE